MTDLSLLSAIKVTVTAARGPRGLASGPLGAGSVDAETITNSASGQSAVRAKLGAASAQDLNGVAVQSATTATRLPFSSTASSNVMLSPRPTIRFNAAMDAARAAGVLRVTVVGDSITEGAGMSYANTYAENLQRLLQIEMPGVEIILTNLAIGGRNLAQLADPAYTATAANVSPGNFYLPAPTGINSSYWPGGSVTGKSLRDHVRDTNPDAVFMAWGENSGLDTVAFKAAFDSFEAYTQTWAKKPWFVLVSALIPEGAEADRQDKQAFADFLHFTAIERGYGHIDANAYYRLMRDGKRRNLVPSEEERDFAGFDNPALWATQNTATLSGSTLTTGPEGRAERKVAARDFDVSDLFTLGSNDAIWRLEGRRRPGTNDVWLVQTSFADQGDGNGGAIRIYFRDGTVRAATRFPAKAAGQQVRIRVKFYGPLIQVWHDGVLLLTYRSTLGLYAGAVAIGTAAGSGSHRDFRLAVAEEYQAAQAGYFSASYLLNDDLHHPTDEGAFQTYIPAMRQFVSELVEAWRQPLRVTTGRQTAAKSFPTGALEFQADTAITFRVARAQDVPVTIAFGYKNPNPSTALLTLQVNGTGVANFYLDRTATTGADNAQFFATTLVPVPAGDVTMRLAFAPPAGGTQPVTSTGTGNDRLLVAEVAVL